MPSGFGQSTSRSTQYSSLSTNNNNDAGDFECNICFDFAQEPVVTLCGHLFCWPCLYKWLHIHSRSQECPVCKALVKEDNIVPLYGRGKNSTDPRTKSVPGIDIPNRPTGQRPETAPDPPPSNTHTFAQNGFGFMGGLEGLFAPTISTRFGNFTLSAFGGLVLPLLSVHVHRFHDANMYMYSSTFDGHLHPVFQPRDQQQQADFTLKMLALLIVFSVALALFWT